MKFWLAKSKGGELTLHRTKPIYHDGYGWTSVCTILNSQEFPDVTFENSPQHGDMKVQRDRSLKIDGIIGTNLNNFIDFSSKDFSILEDYIQRQIDENTFEEKKVGQHFIINIPFN